MKPIIVSLWLAFLFLAVLSCTEEEETAPYKRKIKRVLHFGSIENTEARTIDEFRYDSKNRLIKIQSDHQALVYEYDKDNHVNKEYSYSINGDNYTLSYLTTYHYSYRDGQLISKETVLESFYSMTIYSYKEVYGYQNGRLARSKFYNENKLDRMAVYEYTNDLMTKETVYRDSLEQQLYTITGYHYDENKKLAISSMAHSGSMGMKWIQSIYYFYNAHGDLDLVYAKQSENISAGITFCRRYEYY